MHTIAINFFVFLFFRVIHGKELPQDETFLKLTEQFNQFVENSGPFATVPKIATAKQLWVVVARQVPELSWLSQALLSVKASEAPTERSFSIQKRVHGPERSSLKDENVEHEMFIRMNLKKLQI